MSKSEDRSSPKERKKVESPPSVAGVLIDLGPGAQVKIGALRAHNIDGHGAYINAPHGDLSIGEGHFSCNHGPSLHVPQVNNFQIGPVTLGKAGEHEERTVKAQQFQEKKRSKFFSGFSFSKGE